MTIQDIKTTSILKFIETFKETQQLNVVTFLKLIEDADEETVLLILQNLQQVLTDAQKSLAQEKNERELTFIAHKLKSSARLIGFDQFSNECEQIENGIKFRNLPENIYLSFKKTIANYVNILTKNLVLKSQAESSSYN